MTDIYKAQYILQSRHQTAGRNNYITVDRSFENLAKLKYLADIVTNQKLIQEEIKSRLNTRKARHHSVESILFSPLLYKNLVINIHTIIISPVVFLWAWNLVSGIKGKT
jgi:hypothetical protein